MELPVVGMLVELHKLEEHPEVDILLEDNIVLGVVVGILVLGAVGNSMGCRVVAFALREEELGC